jgi:hypothetical protein
MVKNLNTIEKSERIRIGKHVPDEQALNTIIINASSNVIEASAEGLYVAPIRTNTGFTSNALCYDVTTKEIIDTGATVAPQDLQGVTEEGNTTTKTVEFNNPTTSFVTASNVGIANSNPMHELSVGGDAYITGNLTVLGETTLISSENLRVKDAIVELGENNTDSDFRFDLGLVMTRPESNVTAAFIESSNEYVIGYTYSSASDRYITVDTANSIEMRVYGNLTADNITGDGANISNVVKFSDLTANVILLQGDIQSNVDILRDEMAANTVTLRSDLQSNVDILRGEMAANTVTLRADLQSNVDILRGEMAANTVTLRSDLQSNVDILRDEMAANTVTLRADLQSNANILRGEMAANTVTLRADLQSNVGILRDEMAANTLTLRDEMAANTVTLRGDLHSNLAIIRGEMAANTVTIRGEMAANTVALRADLHSNLSIIRDEMAANTVALRADIQSNVAIKANIESPVFTGVITGDGGAISNISLQHVTEYGNATDRTISISNSLSLITTGSVGINTPTPQKTLHVGGEILADDNITGVDFYGDDATFTGSLSVSGDTLIYGDLEVRGNTTYLSTQNLLVEDPILALGANNTSSSLDTGLIVLVYQGDSNVAFGYRGANNEFIISHTLSSPEDSELTPDTSNAINVHVYGDLTADTFIGDGGFLSNIASNLEQIALNGNVTTQTLYLNNDVTGLDVVANVVVGGNVTASTFIGDGGFLSNIASNLEQIALNGNVTTQTLYLDNATTGLDVDANVVVGGNVTASTFIGDGGFLSNIASNLEQIALNGNVTTQTLYLNNTVTGLEVDANVVVGGNVTANVFLGDGGLLSNIAATLQEVSDNGNTTTNTLQFLNAHTAFTTDLTSNVGVKLDQLSNVVITSPQADHLLTYDGANWINDYNIHNFIKVHNTTGDTLYKGNVVYIVDSFNNNVANVALAKSDSASTMPSIGLIHEDIADGQEGSAVAYGKVDGIDTSGYTEGQTVYVSNTSTGNLMNTKPYGLGDQIQNVGICIREHANNGVVFVTGVGRSNDIPNAPISSSPNYVYVNETNNDMKKIAPENLLTKLQTLEQVVNTGNTVSNVISASGFTATQNVSIGGLTQNYIPIVGADNYLMDSAIRKDNGNIIISADTEITGDLIVTGNSYVVSSNNVIIEDRILGLANNNPSHDFDTGIIMEHPGHNIALIHHGDEDRFSMGYTQNTVTDNHVLPDSNVFFLDILGNVEVQNTITIQQNAYFNGNVGISNSEPAHDLSVGSNFYVDDDGSNVVHVEGNIAATRFIGDGAYLTNIASTFEQIIINGNETSNTVNFNNAISIVTTGAIGIANSAPAHDLSVGSNFYVDDDGSNVVHVDGNVYATRFIGDGSFLENIASTFEQIIINGNVTSNTVEFENAISIVTTGAVGIANSAPEHDLSVGSNLYVDDTGSNVIHVTGNVYATRFIGDGSFLENIASSLEEIIINGNVTSNTVEFNNAISFVTTGNVGISNNAPEHNLSVGSNLYADDAGSNVIHVTGNIYATRFIGDGSSLENIASNLEEIVLNGNVTSQTIHIENVVSLTTTGNVGIANTNPTCDLAIGSNVCFKDVSSNILTVDGNILAHQITLDSIAIRSAYALEYITQTGNTTSNTVEFTNEATGLVTTANVGIANAHPVHTLDVGSNLWIDDVGSNVLYVNGNVHVAGAQLVTEGKLGVSNANPEHDLSVSSNLYVDDDGSNVLVVHGNASFGSTITLGAVEITTAYNLEEVTGEGNTTTQVIQFLDSNVGTVSSGGIVINKDAFACKHYSYSNVSVPTDFENVAMTFASNVFHAKITAQLTHGNEEVSTMTLDVQGGTRDGATSSLNIATGPGSVFGNTNTKPWNGTVSTTPTQVILEPSATGTTAYGVDLYVEYKSSAPDGKLESISIGNDSVKSFVY